MKIKYVHQINPRASVTYKFESEKITATLDGKSDTFDFTGMPNDSIANITSDLEISTVLAAEKDSDGILWVELYKSVLESEYTGKEQPWEDA